MRKEARRTEVRVGMEWLRQPMWAPTETGESKEQHALWSPEKWHTSANT